MGVSRRSHFLHSPWTSPCLVASFGLLSDSSGPLGERKPHWHLFVYSSCIHSFIPSGYYFLAWPQIACKRQNAERCHFLKSVSFTQTQKKHRELSCDFFQSNLLFHQYKTEIPICLHVFSFPALFINSSYSLPASVTLSHFFSPHIIMYSGLPEMH